MKCEIFATKRFAEVFEELCANAKRELWKPASEKEAHRRKWRYYTCYICRPQGHRVKVDRKGNPLKGECPVIDRLRGPTIWEKVRRLFKRKELAK